MLKLKLIVPVAGIFLSLLMVNQAKSATVILVPDRDDENKMNVRAIQGLEISDPDDPRLNDPDVLSVKDFYDVIFEYDPFKNTDMIEFPPDSGTIQEGVFGTPPSTNVAIPLENLGGYPCNIGLCFWGENNNNPNRTNRAALALAAINEAMNNNSAQPIDISGESSILPFLNPVEDNFYLVPVSYNANGMNLVQYIQGMYNGGDWISNLNNLPSEQLNAFSMYAKFTYKGTQIERVPVARVSEPSNITAIVAIGTSLLLLGVKKNPFRI